MLKILPLPKFPLTPTLSPGERGHRQPSGACFWSQPNSTAGFIYASGSGCLILQLGAPVLAQSSGAATRWGELTKSLTTKSWGRKEPRGGGISTTDYADFRGWGKGINTAETRQTRRRSREKAEQVLNHWNLPYRCELPGYKTRTLTPTLSHRMGEGDGPGSARYPGRRSGLRSELRPGRRASLVLGYSRRRPTSRPRQKHTAATEPITVHGFSWTYSSVACAALRVVSAARFCHSAAAC
jgi:hypothetical protein